MATEKITAEVLALLLARVDYDEATGAFVYKKTPRGLFANKLGWSTWNARRPGKSAAHIRTSHAGKKYAVVQIGRTVYSVHRVVFFMKHGWLPEQIDHLDGNGLNNRADNLAPATNTTNAMNRRRHKDRVLPTGVYLTKRGTYEASIRVNKKYKHLGTYKTVGEAAAVRKAAEIRHGFHPNHGSVRPL